MFNRIAKIISGLLSAAIIFTSLSFGKIALPSAAAEEPDEEALRLLWEEYLDGLPRLRISFRALTAQRCF